MSLSRIIKEKALELGFVDAGITTAEPFTRYAEELASRPEMYAWLKELSEKSSVRNLDLFRFADPACSFPEVKSILVVVDGYFAETFPSSLTGKIGRCYLKGLFCPVGTVHKERRKNLQKFLGGLGIKAPYGQAPARMSASRAGVTNYGKNCFAFANRAAGESSFVVTEPYLLDRELAPDSPTLKVHCPDDCHKCLETCPTGALYAPLKMDPRRCIAYHTFFNVGEIPREIRLKMGTWVYGCDLCQEVCPRNQDWLLKEKPMESSLLQRPTDFQLIPLLTMSQAHYEERVWPYLFYIRKENRKLWQRNAAVALGNQRDPDALPHLIQALSDPEALVRGHVAWALGEIGGKVARTALAKHRKLEDQETVRREIEEALARS